MNGATTLQREVMLALSGAGATIFRNNSGVAVYPDGSRVRYGIANPGGADLIGWQSIVITPDMVGSQVARWLAVEVKSGRGRLTCEQAHFLEVVRAAGGLASVARSAEDALRLIGAKP